MSEALPRGLRRRTPWTFVWSSHLSSPQINKKAPLLYKSNEKNKITRTLFLGKDLPVTSLGFLLASQSGERKITITQAEDYTLELIEKDMSFKTIYPLFFKNEEMSIEVGAKKLTILFPSDILRLYKKTTHLFPDNIGSNNLIEKCKDVKEEGSVECFPIYRFITEKYMRFLGIFSVKIPIIFELKAQTGQIVKQKVPWYIGFFPFLFS